MSPRAEMKNGALSRDNRLPQCVCIDRLFTEIIVLYSRTRPRDPSALKKANVANPKWKFF
jgi:hypothetical protein